MKKSFLFILLFAFTSSFSQILHEFRAVKITNVDSDILFDDKKIADGMDYLASIGINVILTVVWNSHGADGDYTLYPSKVMEEYFGRAMHPAFPTGRDPLKRIIIEAHRNGMEVFPWFEMGFSTSYSQNGGHIIKSYPNWALKDNTGKLCVKNGFDWMSAINPEVQKFIIALTTEVVDNYDLDGIEYSDRIPAMPVEGGYDAVTVSIYQAEHNGAAPPSNYKDANWMRWRADKLSQFYKNARDSIKARGDHLVVSSSPSVYPWSYQEYLQDSKTWLDSDIIDNIIPQVYRYSYSDYVYELNQSLSHVPLSKRDTFFSGMLIYLRGDNYLISPDFLLKSIQANRDRQVHGEAFFFYEGLRLHNNHLGDTLKATFYKTPALLPYRQGNVWRPKAQIVNENDSAALITGNWDHSDIAGFKPCILIKKDSEYGSITYHFTVAQSGWYDVFAYIVTGPLATDQAHYTIYSENDSTEAFVNQQNYYHRGWQHLKSVYLSKGSQKILKLDNANVPSGQYVVADAAMIMINRKLSPDVVFTHVAYQEQPILTVPKSFQLLQNYPNPFNSFTKIPYVVLREEFITLKIFDILGNELQTVIQSKQKPGRFEIMLHLKDMPSGIYLYLMQTKNQSEIKKFILLK